MLVLFLLNIHLLLMLFKANNKSIGTFVKKEMTSKDMRSKELSKFTLEINFVK